MIEWLAVIVICSGGECAFWASVKEPIESREKCERLIDMTTQYFNQQNIETPVAACLPIKWIKA